MQKSEKRKLSKFYRQKSQVTRNVNFITFISLLWYNSIYFIVFFLGESTNKSLGIFHYNIFEYAIYSDAVILVTSLKCFEAKPKSFI